MIVDTAIDQIKGVFEVAALLSESPLIQFLGLVGLLIFVGYAVVVLDTIRRTVSRKR